MAIFALIYVAVFFLAIFYSLKFEFSKEGRDERGQAIANQSYGIIFPMIPLVWLILELTDDYLHAFTFEEYRMAIWFLVTGLYILHALIIFFQRKRA